MAPDISARNGKSQDVIFLAETVSGDRDLLKSHMAKRNPPEPREIFLGDWLNLWEIGPTKAAEIAGCTQSYISNIVRGEKININALYLLRLSEHFEISVNDFYRKPPTESQIASIRSLSPKAQEAVLRAQRQKRA